MTLGEDFGKEQNERMAWLREQQSKAGDYTGDNCPNCSRERIMLGTDRKRRCEKCAWCIEDGTYDDDFVSYVHGL